MGSDHNTSTQERSTDTETSGESLMRKSDMHLQEIYTEALKSNGVSCL